jgi:hypothetical protein
MKFVLGNHDETNPQTIAGILHERSTPKRLASIPPWIGSYRAAGVR